MALVESQPTTNGSRFANTSKLMSQYPSSKSSCYQSTKNLKRSTMEAPPEIVKNERMDPARQKQCNLIMKKLINHTSGLPSKQLDLSGIQRKLDCKAYPTMARFAADVMRILHNAMQETPPTDIVHIKAKELNNIFNVNWQKKNVWWIDVQTAPPQKKLKTETVKTKSTSAPVLQNTCKAKKRQQSKTINQSAVKKSNLELSKSTDSDGAAVSERNSQQIPHQAAPSHEPAGISKKNIQRSSVKDSCTPMIEQPLLTHQCTMNSTTLEPCKGPHDNYPISEDQFSPTKALHVKMMKARYADIIKKAQQTLLCQLDDVVQTHDKVEMQREKQDLEKLDLKEKKAKFEHERRMQRQKEREAARIALDEMEKSAKQIENMEKETHEMMKIFKYGSQTIMENIGLFLKD